MAKTLILIRHSYAESGSFQKGDFNRQLTEKGVLYAQRQSQSLYQYISRLDSLYSSDAKRALQTANILRDEIKFIPEVLQEHFLYTDYTTQDFIDFVNSFDNSKKCIAVVGHNPSIANIAFRLTSGFMHSVTPGTIIIIEFDCDSWKDIQVETGEVVKVFA